MESVKTLCILCIALAAAACLSQEPTVPAPASADRELPFYTPFFNRILTANVPAVPAYTDEKMNIQTYFLVQSNQADIPAPYPIAAKRISLLRHDLAVDGLILDYAPAWDEIIYVLQGKIKIVTQNKQEDILSANTAIGIRSGIKRRFVNLHNDSSSVLVFTCPSYDPQFRMAESAAQDGETDTQPVSDVKSLAQAKASLLGNIQIYKLFYPDTYGMALISGMVILPPHANIRNVSLDKECTIIVTAER